MANQPWRIESSRHMYYVCLACWRVREWICSNIFVPSFSSTCLFLHCSSVCLLIWYVCLSCSFYVCKWLCVPYVCEYFTCLSPSFHDSVSLLVCLSVCLSLSFICLCVFGAWVCECVSLCLPEILFWTKCWKPLSTKTKWNCEKWNRANKMSSSKS